MYDNVSLICQHNYTVAKLQTTVWRKILTGENIDEFQQFVNIFPIKIFRLVSYLYKMNE